MYNTQRSTRLAVKEVVTEEEMPVARDAASKKATNVAKKPKKPITTSTVPDRCFA